MVSVMTAVGVFWQDSRCSLAGSSRVLAQGSLLPVAVASVAEWQRGESANTCLSCLFAAQADLRRPFVSVWLTVVPDLETGISYGCPEGAGAL